MAGFQRLIPYIYHEKQQPGSMLCAQHALNSLLQGNYFTAPDLSDIARSLDALEESYDNNNTGSSSTNMDDTGFFSVQVLDNALRVWGLNLTRWRSEDMRPYQEHPQAQLGFILNLEQHWFTLRRFGNASANIDEDDGNGHWFNLNSFFQEPEWVGRLYLGMVLQQAEVEGYSVFAVTQADPESPLALPRTEADVIASTLPEPSSAPNRRSRQTFRTTTDTEAGRNLPQVSSEHEGFEDEDLELQAALQASLMNAGIEHHFTPPPLPSPLSAPGAAILGSSSVSNPMSFSESGPSSAGPDSGSRTPQYIQTPATFAPFRGHAEREREAASMERNIQTPAVFAPFRGHAEREREAASMERNIQTPAVFAPFRGHAEREREAASMERNIQTPAVFAPFRGHAEREREAASMERNIQTPAVFAPFRGHAEREREAASMERNIQTPAVFAPFRGHAEREREAASMERNIQTPAVFAPFRGHADVDPVTASMERNRVLLQRMKEQQEYARREMWNDDDITPEEHAAIQERRQRRQREEEEAEAELQRAIQESKALAKRPRLAYDEDDDDDMEIDAPSVSNPRNAQPSTSKTRVYDEEDPELQAALRASLEHVPPGWQHPDLEPSTPSHIPFQPATSSVQSVEAKSPLSDTASASGDSAGEAPDVGLSLNDIREKRLARFGL
ncbi:Josephin-domain-containing protein [Crassisporium funariophilum]|nr:Josephin-domain-containing protein [Crassisporium funariophilum]